MWAIIATCSKISSSPLACLGKYQRFWCSLFYGGAAENGEVARSGIAVNYLLCLQPP
jgi:hypothetical protein